MAVEIERHAAASKWQSVLLARRLLYRDGSWALGSAVGSGNGTDRSCLDHGKRNATGGSVPPSGVQVVQPASPSDSSAFACFLMAVWKFEK